MAATTEEGPAPEEAGPPLVEVQQTPAVAGVESMVAPRGKGPVGVQSMVAPQGPSVAAPRFVGNERFEVLRRIGAGGMGEVYEVLDKDRDQRVALKTLRNFGPLELFLFKNEFRSLADIVHPNLIGLHELLTDGDTWFFTMDYVPGIDMLDWVRGESVPSACPDSSASTAGGGGVAATLALDAGTLPPSDTVSLTPRQIEQAIAPDTVNLQLPETGPTSRAPVADTVAVPADSLPSVNPVASDTVAVDPSELGRPSTIVDPTEAVDTSDAMIAGASRPSISSANPPQPAAVFPPLDEEGLDRLRTALTQLCSAVHALHRLGKLHRDIKPSNTLVDGNSRLVLLDFGLIVDMRDDDVGPSEGLITGTARYMSPEQARGEALTPASDWYAVGCMLHEALTGRVLFEGNTLDIVLSKARGPALPPLPDDVVARTPKLAALCTAMLAQTPEERPPGPDILEQLGVEASEIGGDTLTTTVHETRTAEQLIGRDEHLAVLRKAWASACDGGTEVVFVHGRSGMGKSELISRFLAEVGESDALVLTSRCYEREWVPFKAVDPLIDALLQALMSRGGSVPVPINVGALIRLFPVLERIPALADATGAGFRVTEPTELRRRAVAGLADLLRKIARDRPIALFVDDLQWSDHDSVYVFEELLGEPSPPPLLLLGAYRDEEAETSPLLRAFAGLTVSEAEAPVQSVEVAPLNEQDARTLAALQLGDDDELAEAIAAESRGVPFFIDELARYVRSVPEGTWRGVPHLDEVVRSRVAALPTVARRLLEVAATAGQPTSLSLLAGVRDVAEAWKVAIVLQGEHLLHSLGSGGTKGIRVECYHDRIREAVFDSLAEKEARGLHLSLADGFEAEDDPDAERLAVHLLAAGEEARALPWVKTAAQSADDALAFRRAAVLYGKAIELEEDDDERRRLREAQAQALVNAGRGVEAATAYLQAAEGATTEDAWRLTQAAADQLLRAGSLEKGNELVQQVLVEAGMSIPSNEVSVILRYLGNRIALSFRGLDFVERDASELSVEELGRLDVALSASTVLAMTDTLAGALMHTRNLKMSLDAGEPYRVVRALGVEASFAAVVGMKGVEKAEGILETAWDLSERLGDPRAEGFSRMTRALVHFQAGRWSLSAESAKEASEVLLESCRGMHYEVGLARAYELADVAWLGRLRAFAHHTNDWIDEATDRGDLNAWLLLRLGGPIQVEAIKDDPERAAHQVLDVRGRWPDSRFGILDVYTQRALADLALYRGDATAAMEHAQALWTGLFKSQLKVVAILKATAFHLMGRAMLAAGQDPKKVEKHAKKLGVFGPAWGEAPAALLRGASGGVEGWQAALTTCETADMAMHAAAARWRLGEATGGKDGDAQLAAARKWFEGEGVVCPERMVAMLAPNAE